MNFTVVIPARYASERLPGKPLIDLCGKPMIQRVYEQACKSDADCVVVATDDQRVAAVVESFGGVVVMTRSDHVSGTDRIQEVTTQLGLAEDSPVVNVQGDEPLIPPEIINQVAALLSDQQTLMTTLAEPIDSLEDFLDPNIVKVVTTADGTAIYFSRAPIPWDRTKGHDGFPEVARRHVGIYGYRVKLLNEFVSWPPGQLEQIEKLEQLRILERGIKITVATAVMSIPPGIDTASDLERTLAVLSDN